VKTAVTADHAEAAVRMTPTRRSRPCAAGALVAAGLLMLAATARAAPVLREADVSITMTSPISCEVSMKLTVDGAREIDHRVEAVAGSRIELVDTHGAAVVGVQTIGRTQSLVLRPAQPHYEFRYRAQQPADVVGRCPVWLPAVPADGRSRAVSIHVQLPPGATPGPSMPAFDWTGTQGSTRIGHLPAFVRAPYAPRGESPGRSIGQVMDAAAIVVFGAAMGIWAWRRKR
jgi:hypothetical protein